MESNNTFGITFLPREEPESSELAAFWSEAYQSAFLQMLANSGNDAPIESLAALAIKAADIALAAYVERFEQ